VELNYIKYVERKVFLRLNATELPTLTSTPSFANTMLYAVLFIQIVWKYTGVAEENLFFFCGGNKRERKSSFADVGFGVG